MENTNDRTLQANSPQRENEQTDAQDFGLTDNPNETGLDRFETETTQQSQYTSARDEDDEDDDRDDDEDDRDTDDDDDDDDDFDSTEDDDDEAPAQTDWGVVDPLEHPGPPSGMDPTAPGSAV